MSFSRRTGVQPDAKLSRARGKKTNTVRLPPSFNDRRTAFFVLAAPAFLNDPFLIALSGSDGVYLIDYLTRCTVLAFCFLWPTASAIAAEPPTYLGSPNHSFWYLLGLLFVLIAVPGLPIAAVETILAAETGWPGWFHFHRPDNSSLYMFDITIGLLLVAITEELVFRKFALSWLKRTGRTTSEINLISAALFSLAHWSNGSAKMMATFLTGVLFMSLYQKVKRLWPFVFAHYWVNVIAFA